MPALRCNSVFGVLYRYFETVKTWMPLAVATWKLECRVNTPTLSPPIRIITDDAVEINDSL